MNASIEAACSGEQEIGFTIVIDEIIKLAERSELSVKDISLIVQGLQFGVQHIVKYPNIYI